MILLLLAIGSFGYAIHILFGAKADKKHEHPRIQISLMELSKMWTRHNEIIEEAPVINDLASEELRELRRLQQTEIASMENRPVNSGLEIQDKPDVTTKAGTSAADNTAKTDISAMPAPGSAAAAASVPRDSLDEFIRDFIAPYKHIFDSQNVFEVLRQVIEILHKHGHNPSIVLDNKDQEAVSLVSVKDNLAKTTLKDHSCLVGVILVNKIKETYAQYENIIPKAIIAALAHDIGKIPELRLTGLYNTKEHPLVSANKLNELFFGNPVFWAKDVIKAVSEHHISATGDQFTQLLQQADRQARQQELLKYSKDFTIKPFREWFRAADFLRMIEPYINVSQSGNKWQAFTFKGVIYLRPDFIYDTAKKMCRENKVLDLSFAYEADKENALKMIVNELADAHCIHETLKTGFFAMRYEISTQMGQKQKHMLTPLKIDGPLMDKLAEIERRKIGFFEIINSIEPVVQGNFS